jgi:hypothetical protein
MSASQAMNLSRRVAAVDRSSLAISRLSSLSCTKASPDTGNTINQHEFHFFKVANINIPSTVVLHEQQEQQQQQQQQQ